MGMKAAAAFRLRLGLRQQGGRCAPVFFDTDESRVLIQGCGLGFGAFNYLPVVGRYGEAGICGTPGTRLRAMRVPDRSPECREGGREAALVLSRGLLSFAEHYTSQ